MENRVVVLDSDMSLAIKDISGDRLAEIKAIDGFAVDWDSLVVPVCKTSVLAVSSTKNDDLIFLDYEKDWLRRYSGIGPFSLVEMARNTAICSSGQRRIVQINYASEKITAVDKSHICIWSRGDLESWYGLFGTPRASVYTLEQWRSGEQSPDWRTKVDRCYSICAVSKQWIALAEHGSGILDVFSTSGEHVWRYSPGTERQFRLITELQDGRLWGLEQGFRRSQPSHSVVFEPSSGKIISRTIFDLEYFPQCPANRGAVLVAPRGFCAIPSGAFTIIDF